MTKAIAAGWVLGMLLAASEPRLHILARTVMTDVALAKSCAAVWQSNYQQLLNALAVRP